MLTENQIGKLILLKEEFPEYSLIIEHCIFTWKNKKCNPSNQNGFGLQINNNFSLSAKEECCLIGACLDGFSDLEDKGYWELFALKYSITESDARNMTSAFDDFRILELSSLTNKARQFGYKVAEIVL